MCASRCRKDVHHNIFPLVVIIIVSFIEFQEAESELININQAAFQRARARNGLAGSGNPLQELLLKSQSVGQATSNQRASSFNNDNDFHSNNNNNLDNEQQQQQQQYKCAKHCRCSIVQVLEDKNPINNNNADKVYIKPRIITNLTQAKCESSQFSDILTIDRRTQIIHISLPDLQQQSLNNDNNNSKATGIIIIQKQQTFRMPRLVQFNLLKEIVIINLKFQVCDSEVFKRGQKLLKFKLNFNQLNRISKGCFKYLDKLIELNLDFNLLEELESALFNSLINLKHLSISNNKLSELASHQFANLTKLRTLNLNGNLFKTINLHLFEPMQNSLNLLVLANNQIKTFIYSPVVILNQLTTITPINTNNNLLSNKTSNQNTNHHINKQLITTNNNQQFAGIVFRNLIKLNVDNNKFERIKLLQLHRFFNVKFLSIRQNNISTIKDKAFNGLRLFELNLSFNKLQTISKCAFCNATIKRLILSNNNISIPLPSVLLAGAGDQLVANSQALVVSSQDSTTSGTIEILPEPTMKSSSILSSKISLPVPQAQQSAVLEPISSVQQQQVGSSQNMLILSQSIFGPLFNQLEYLDLSNNELLAEALDLLLEPLLQLEYLNIASVGLDRSLPTPQLFKNNRQLKYLNLSHNQLDLITSETIEQLTSLELLDLSSNKFNEIDESFLVTLDYLNALKIINFGSNPWVCSQCKVGPLYDWILRSNIYNTTCINTLNNNQASSDAENNLDNNNNNNNNNAVHENDETTTSNLLDFDNNSNNNNVELKSRSSFNQADNNNDRTILDNNNSNKFVDYIYSHVSNNDISDLINGIQQQDGDDEDGASDESVKEALLLGNYLAEKISDKTVMYEVMKQFATANDDVTIQKTISTLTPSKLTSSIDFNPNDYCMKCEFPNELKSYFIHDLSSSDFKFCSGDVPRLSASEPKIGLTLAFVIIGILLFIIVGVIIIYRKKNNTYYTNELDTDQLNGGSSSAKKQQQEQVFSISSDVENHYNGDATDYSSPPMSQSLESYSQEEEEEEDDDDEDIDEGEEDDGEGEEEEMDYDEEFEEEQEENETTGGDSQSNSNNGNLAAYNTKRLADAELERQRQLANYNSRNNNINNDLVEEESVINNKSKKQSNNNNNSRSDSKISQIDSANNVSLLSNKDANTPSADFNNNNYTSNSNSINSSAINQNKTKNKRQQSTPQSTSSPRTHFSETSLKTNENNNSDQRQAEQLHKANQKQPQQRNKQQAPTSRAALEQQQTQVKLPLKFINRTDSLSTNNNNNNNKTSSGSRNEQAVFSRQTTGNSRINETAKASALKAKSIMSTSKDSNASGPASATGGAYETTLTNDNLSLIYHTNKSDAATTTTTEQLRSNASTNTTRHKHNYDDYANNMIKTKQQQAAAGGQHANLRQQSSLQSTASGSQRRSVKSALTIESTRRPQSSAASMTTTTTNLGPTHANARNAAANLGRQRFAISKDASQTANANQAAARQQANDSANIALSARGGEPEVPDIAGSSRINNNQQQQQQRQQYKSRQIADSAVDRIISSPIHDTDYVANDYDDELNIDDNDIMLAAAELEAATAAVAAVAADSVSNNANHYQGQQVGGHQAMIKQQKRVQTTPTMSDDATTADSIALEALDFYVPSDFDDEQQQQQQLRQLQPSPLGGALEVDAEAASPEPETMLNRTNQHQLISGDVSIGCVNNSYNNNVNRHRTVRSSHSALTQTSINKEEQEL